MFREAFEQEAAFGEFEGKRNILSAGDGFVEGNGKYHGAFVVDPVVHADGVGYVLADFQGDGTGIAGVDKNAFYAGELVQDRSQDSPADDVGSSVFLFKYHAGTKFGMIHYGVACKMDKTGRQVCFQEHALEIGRGDVHFGPEIKCLPFPKMLKPFGDELHFPVEFQNQIAKRVGPQE